MSAIIDHMYILEKAIESEFYLTFICFVYTHVLYTQAHPHWLKSVMVSYVACTDCENDKIQLTSHSSFVMVSYVACTDYENDKIQLTSHSSFVMVLYVACMDCENNKIRFTSHSSFVMVLYVACTDCENDKIRWTNYSTFHTSRVQTVSDEGRET